MAVSFNYHGVRPIRLANKKRLRVFIESLCKTEGRQVGDLSYVFTTDEYLLSLNRDFLQHDYFTDVLTFDLSRKGKPVYGEVYISVPRVKENSQTEKVPFTKELLRVAFHAALHLCGYGDKTKREIARMREKEDEYLLLYEQLRST